MIEFPRLAIPAAQAHAIAEYPRESCGIFVNGVFCAVENVAENPHDEFQMPADTWIKYGAVQAIIHSHIADRHPLEPSAADMARQAETGVPWGIIHAGPDSASDVLWFGDHVLDEPLIGRQFVWNVRDCWQLARAYYWQKMRIKVPTVAVSPRWNHAGEDRFSQHIPEVGFVRIHEREVTIGDFALLQIRGQVPNHCAIMCDHEILLHHLEGRLSCREPAHRWAPFIKSWWRLAE